MINVKDRATVLFIIISPRSLHDLGKKRIILLLKNNIDGFAAWVCKNEQLRYGGRLRKMPICFLATVLHKTIKT
jgi:hypothetical protein